MTLDPCRRARAHFSDHLDGERLPFFSRVLVGVHLTICPACRRVNRSLQATQVALHALRDADLAQDLPQDLPPDR